MARTEGVLAKPSAIQSDWPRVKVLINDNYCVTQRSFVELVKRTVNSLADCQTIIVNCLAVNHEPFVAGQPQKRPQDPL